MRPLGPLPGIALGSMTMRRANARARGEMRKREGVGDGVMECWSVGVGETAATGTVTPPYSGGASLWLAVVAFVVAALGERGGATAGALKSGIASPGLPTNPTVLATGTLTPGCTMIFSNVPSAKLST